MLPTCNEICLLHITNFLFIEFFKARSSTIQYFHHYQIYTTIAFLGVFCSNFQILKKKVDLHCLQWLMFQNKHPFGESNVAPFWPLYFFLGKCHGWVLMALAKASPLDPSMVWSFFLSQSKFQTNYYLFHFVTKAWLAKNLWFSTCSSRLLGLPWLGN